MRYTFTCENCGASEEVHASIHQGAPDDVACRVKGCRGVAQRNWKADAPMIDTSSCKDHDDIPMQKRVASAHDRGTPDQQERAFNSHIDGRRKELADGGNRGSLRHKYSVPTHLFHGKIKETGDKKYWDDPKNLERHSSCKVSK